MKELKKFSPDVLDYNLDNNIKYKIVETVSPFTFYDKGNISEYTGLDSGYSHYEFIKLTENCKRKLRVTTMYSELTRTLNFNTPGFINHAGKEWFQAIRKALRRGVELELIISDPPAFDPWNSLEEMKRFSEGIPNAKVNIYYINWNFFKTMYDFKDMPYLTGWCDEPYKPAASCQTRGWTNKNFPLAAPMAASKGDAGVLHTKCYIWDSDTYYTGSQTFGFPFAPEIGIILSNQNATIQATKYYEFLKFCSILQQGGYTDTIDSIYTGMFPVPNSLKFEKTIDNPLIGDFTDTNPIHNYNGSNFKGSMVVGVSPHIQGVIQGATPEIEIFTDIFNRATKTLDISIMTLGGYPGWFPYWLKWEGFDELFINAVKRGVRIRLIFAIYGSVDSSDGLINSSSGQYYQITHFQKMKNQLNKIAPPGAGLDIKFVKGGKTPQKFDEEGELYCFCEGMKYCQTPKQNPDNPKPGTQGRPGICEQPITPDDQTFYSMMYHKKMIVADNAVYISTSNFTLDYFLVSGDFCVYIKSLEKNFPMRDTLTNMFQKDWMSAEKLELISCLIAEKYKQKWNDPNNPSQTELLYVDPADICGKDVISKTNFDDVFCVSGLDKQKNMCVKETKKNSSILIIIIIFIVCILVFILSLFFKYKGISNM